MDRPEPDFRTQPCYLSRDASLKMTEQLDTLRHDLIAGYGAAGRRDRD
nr:hypothetical protein [Komagataeibacter xylinus]